MALRFEPDALGLARRCAWPSPIAGAVVALGVYFGDGDSSLSMALAWGGAMTVAAFTFVFLRDFWLRFWTVEVSAAGIHAVSRQTEHEVKWEDVVSFEESYHGDSWKVQWGRDERGEPRYLASESLTLSLAAYAPEEAALLVESLRSGVGRSGVLGTDKFGASQPAP